MCNTLIIKLHIDIVCLLVCLFVSLFVFVAVQPIVVVFSQPGSGL
jgi:hypothetical protein